KLDEAGINIRAVGAIENVFLPAGDKKTAICIDGAEVTGVKPAVVVDGLAGGFGVFKVPRGYGGPAHEQFSIFGDTYLTIGERLPQPAGFCVADPVGGYPAALRGPIRADEWNTDQLKESHDPRRHSGTRIGNILHPAAQRFLDDISEFCF